MRMIADEHSLKSGKAIILRLEKTYRSGFFAFCEIERCFDRENQATLSEFKFEA